MTKQIVWTLLVRVLLIAAGFLSSIITARFLGPEGRGVFFYWSTLAALAIQFGNLGLHSSNTYLLAKGHARLSTLAANSLRVSLIGGAVLGGLVTLFLYVMDGTLSDRWQLLLPTLIIIPSGLYFLLATNLLVAEDRINEYNGFELANRYSALAVLLIAAWYWSSPEALLTTVSVFAALMCLPLYAYLQKLDKNEGPSMSLFRKGLGYAMRAYLTSALSFIVLRINVFLLERYRDAETLGTWSISAQIIDILIVIPSTFALILMPKIMRSDKPFQLMNSHLGLLSIIMLSVCMIVSWVGRDVILLIYGERFEPAYNVLLWGLPSAFTISLISIISQYLASEGMPVALIWIWLIGLVIEFTLSMWLIPIHGGAGAMISLSVAYVVILVMVWGLAASHYIKHRG